MMKFLRTLTRSLHMYLVIMFPYRRWHFPFNKPSTVNITEVDIMSRGQTLRPDVYRKIGEVNKKHPAIIIYVPLAQEGKRDPSVTNFMRGLVALGYIVMVPAWPHRTIGTIETTDIDDLIESVHWLRGQSDVDPNRIGIVAVSYGVGPTVIALNKGLADKVQFVSAIGGYADMKNLAQFALTGTFNFGKIHEKLHPDPYLRTIIYRAAAGFAKNPTDKKHFLKSAETKKSLSSAKLTAAGRRINALLTATDQVTFEAAYTKLTPAIKRWFEQMSPINFLEKIRTPLLVLHSTNDELVPYTESLRLYEKLRGTESASLTLVDVFEHAVPVTATPANVFRIYLPNLWRVVRYIHKILAFQEK